MIKTIASSFILLLFTCTDSEPIDVVETTPVEEVEQVELEKTPEPDSDEESFMLILGFILLNRMVLYLALPNITVLINLSRFKVKYLVN